MAQKKIRLPLVIGTYDTGNIDYGSVDALVLHEGGPGLSHEECALQVHVNNLKNIFCYRTCHCLNDVVGHHIQKKWCSSQQTDKQTD